MTPTSSNVDMLCAVEHFRPSPLLGVYFMTMTRRLLRNLLLGGHHDTTLLSIKLAWQIAW